MPTRRCRPSRKSWNRTLAHSVWSPAIDSPLARRSPTSLSLCFESLEDRRLLATVSLGPEGTLAFDNNGFEQNDIVISTISGGSDLLIHDRNNAINVSSGNFVNTPDVNSVVVPIASLVRIQINARSGDDVLTIDHGSSQANRITLPIFYDGGDGGFDTLAIQGGGVGSMVTHTFVNASDGSVDFDGSTIAYVGLEPVDDNLGAIDRVFNFTGGSESITLSDAVGTPGSSMIVSTLGESVTFANPVNSLTIGVTPTAGADTINVEGVDAAFDANLALIADTDDTVNFQSTVTDIGTGRLLVTAHDANFLAPVTTAGDTVGIAVSNHVRFGGVEGSISSVGTVSISADSDGDGNGAILDNSSSEAVNITAIGVVLRAARGIGDALVTDDDIDVAADELAATTESGDISISDDGNLEITTIEGLIGVSITDGNADDSGDDDIRIRASGLLAISGAVVNNDGGDITLAAEGSAATNRLQISDDIGITGGVAGSEGGIALYAGGNISPENGAAITNELGGPVNLSAGEDFNGGTNQAGNPNGEIVMLDGAMISTGSGGISLEATGSIFLSQLSTAGSVRISADDDDLQPSDGLGGITDNLTGEATNVTALSAVLTGSTGVGDVGAADNDIDVVVGTLAATTATGDISISSDGGLDITVVDGLAGVAITSAASTGDVLIRSGTAGPVLDVLRDVTNAGSGDITIAQSGGTGPFNVDIEASVTASGGNVQIVAADDVVFRDRVEDGAAPIVSTTGSGDLEILSGTAFVLGGTATAGNAAGEIVNSSTPGNDYQLRTDEGKILLAATNNVELGTANADFDAGGAAGTVFVIADRDASGSGQVVDDMSTDTNPNIIGSAASIRAADGIGSGGLGSLIDIDVLIDTLAAVTDAGDINVDRDGGGLIIGTVTGHTFAQFGAVADLVGVTITDSPDSNTGNDQITIATDMAPVTASNNVDNFDEGNILLVHDGFDYGDVPDPPFSTLLASGGARHSLGQALILGKRFDTDADGQPSATADGDDSDGFDDDDGVNFTSPLIVGQNATVDVWASSAGLLNAWVDYNTNGSWLDAGEQIFVDEPLNVGMNPLSFLLPTGLLPADTFARFRLDTIGGLSPTGSAAGGEVEDYAVQVVANARFVVDSTGDGPDVDPGDGVAEDVSGNVTLRAAIQEANALANGTEPDEIIFDIGGTGPHVIQPNSALPTITEAVVIDATTEPDYVSTPVVELDGSQAGAESNGLKILSGGSTVRGLAINRFAGAGIELRTGGGNLLEANFVGTDPTGTIDRGNAGNGASIINSAGNTIGGGGFGTRNIFSGNTNHGVLISGVGATSNEISGNFIGADVSGTVDLGNSNRGVAILAGANNMVGGSQADQQNVISGNGDYGIVISGVSATGNLVQGNRIGTDVGGDTAIGNRLGVVINGAGGNTIGGTVPGAGNVISGNVRDAVSISGAGANNTVIQGNRIGTDSDGTTALANGRRGVVASNVSGTQIGGTTGSARNVISGNANHGVVIAGAGGAGSLVENNHIGVDITGLVALGNATGVLIDSAPGNTVGGVAAGNVISGNNSKGVWIAGNMASGNTVSGNKIGTDAAGTAVLGNGNRGVMISGAPDNTVGGTLALDGNLISGNVSFGILITGTNATGNLVQRNLIGTDATGTIAFGNRYGIVINGAPGNTIGGETVNGNVISGNDRHGVLIAGVAASGNFVQGNLIGTNGTGTNALGNLERGIAISGSPNITVGGTTASVRNVISGNTSFGVAISGGNATGILVASNFIGTDLSGTTAVPNKSGISISGSDNNTIGDAAAGAGNVISGNNQHGVIISAGSSDNVLIANRIGTDTSGTFDVGNGFNGVHLREDDNRVGGTSPGEGNLIAFNNNSGVRVTAGTGNRIHQNSIFQNTSMGIDLAGHGLTPNDVNDTDSGANNVQNFPDVTGAVLTGNSLEVNYDATSLPSNSAYPWEVEFFLADADNEEGQSFLGSAGIPVAGQGSHSATLLVTGLGVSVGGRIVATATDSSGNTSEFSPGFAVAGPLTAANGVAGESRTVATLTVGELDSIVAAAIEIWEDAGLAATGVELLSGVEVTTTALDGPYLGMATDMAITLDDDGAGYGWFVDETPFDDDEIAISGSAAGGMDLLTVVLHELGHVLGLDDTYAGMDADDLMYGWLVSGKRRGPTADDADAVFDAV